MDKSILHILDYFFIIFHTVLILFNVFGWIIPRWRFSNLIVLSLTAVSWGFWVWYGYGYCLFTDWHWRIRELLILMTVILTSTDSKTNRDSLSGKWIDLTTAIVFFTSYFISIYFAVKKIILNQKLKNNRRLNRSKKS
jgi:hypothetical protein